MQVAYRACCVVPTLRGQTTLLPSLIKRGAGHTRDVAEHITAYFRVLAVLTLYLCIVSNLIAQTEGVLERLQRYQERYNQWASRHTFVWEIEYSEKRERELPIGRRVQGAVVKSPPSTSLRVRLTIVRTPKLCQVLQERLSGEWGYQSSAMRAYLGEDWVSREVAEIEHRSTGQHVASVVVEPTHTRKAPVIYDDALTLPFAGTIYWTVFLAGTDPFAHLESACSQPPTWELDRTTPSQVWLKRPLGSGDEDRLAMHPEGWVMEFQRRIGRILNRTVVLETIRREGFVVPSKVVIEHESSIQKSRLLARLVELKVSQPIKLEHPMNAEVTDYRLMTPEEMCADHKTELKVVDYLWKGKLPTLAELEQMHRAANPDPLRVPPPRQGARWLLYLPGILLIAIGVYLWWRNRR